MPSHPATRMRRLRRSRALRELVRETTLQPGDLALPMFVRHGEQASTPIASLPGHARLSIDLAVDQARRCHEAGLGAVLLFGVPEDKDADAGEGLDPDGILQRAVRAIRAEVPELVVVTDVCLCTWLPHGHCGLLDDEGHVRNDESVELLARIAVTHAEAGAQVVGPSDMMDGRVRAIRSALDAAGHEHVAIMSYAAKFASACYGPFREAAGSAPAFGDRRGYQMDPANADEAVREALLDVDEGADMLLVKPGLPYLDVLHRIHEATAMPMACYHVSGEYAMAKAAGERGWIDEREVLLESLLAMRRAGADLVFSYAALEAASWLHEA